MSLNQSELLKFVEDLRYVVQSGGGGFEQSGGGAPQAVVASMKILKTLFIFVLYIIIIYIVYIFVFKGYPRLIYDLGTFSFFKRQNLERMFEEHYFMLNHYKFMTKKTAEHAGAPPMVLYNAIIHPQSEHTNIGKYIEELDNFILDKYSEFKFDKRYVRAFSDYYLFYNKIQSIIDSEVFVEQQLSTKKYGTRKISVWEEELKDEKWLLPPYDRATPKQQDKFYMPANTVERHFMTETQNNDYMVQSKKQVPKPPPQYQVPKPPPQYFIKYFEFYELYNEILSRIETTKKRRGIKDGGPSQKISIARLEYQDGEKGRPLLNKIMTLKTMFGNLRYECGRESTEITVNGCNFFMIIPKDLSVARTISFEVVEKYSTAAQIPIDNPKFEHKGYGDFTLIVFEVLQAYETNGYQTISYESLAAHMNNLLSGKPYDAKILLTAYVSLPKSRRTFVAKTLFLNYPHINITNDIISFIHRYPVFSAIYFNEKIADRSLCWKNTMHAYRCLMTINKDLTHITNFTELSNMPTMITNMIQNGRVFKQCINSVLVMDMFLNGFQKEMTQLYEQQYRSDVQFFKELWNPFYHQIVELRVAPYYRRIFMANNMKRSQDNYWHWVWRPIGRSIQRLRREINKAFKRGMTVPADPPPS